MMKKQIIAIPDTKGLRQFGFIFASLMAVLFGLFLPWVFNHATPLWPWIIASVFAVWAMVHPESLKYIYKPWMKFGLFMGMINSTILLSLVFYILFTPISLFFKLIGRDAMHRKQGDSSYWKKSEQPSKQHMERNY